MIVIDGGGGGGEENKVVSISILMIFIQSLHTSLPHWAILIQLTKPHLERMGNRVRRFD